MGGGARARVFLFSFLGFRRGVRRGERKREREESEKSGDEKEIRVCAEERCWSEWDIL